MLTYADVMLTYADVGSGGATRATHSDPWHGSHRAARADDELAAKLAAAQQSCNRGATESPQSEEARDATDAADATHADTGTCRLILSPTSGTSLTALVC